MRIQSERLQNYFRLLNEAICNHITGHDVTAEECESPDPQATHRDYDAR